MLKREDGIGITLVAMLLLLAWWRVAGVDLVFGPAEAATTPTLGPAPRYVTRRAVDGDTLVALPIATEEVLRLSYVNTPERGEHGYDEAQALLWELTGGSEVVLVQKRAGQRDPYRRLLGVVYVGSLCANVEIVRAGWSKYETRYGKAPTELDAKLSAAEAEARAAKRGLWAEE